MNNHIKILVATTVAGLCLLAALGACGQGAANALLWWDPSPTAVSYNLYYGTASRAYTNEQSVGNVTNATISGLLPGTTYYFAATAVDAAGLESVFSNEFIYGVPGITLTSPVGGSGFLAPATITLGANVVSSGHTLSAVRFYSGATLLGQASAPPYTLAWTGVSAGNYSLSAAVTDELGSTVTSTPALIAVTNAPGGSGPPVAPPGTISSIPNQVVVENGTAGPLPFTVTDVQSLLPNLSFYAMSSNLALVPISNILLAGDLTDLTMTVAPVLGQVGSTWITLSVTAGTLSNSTSFLLTVTPLPTIALTSPLNGAGFLAPATITLGANVVSSGHTLSAVQFYSGATLLGQASAPPYTFAWTGVSAGNYSLSAAVTDELGSTVTSTPALIAVTNAPGGSGPPVAPPGTISSIPNQVVVENGTAGPLPFTVTDVQSLLPNLSFYAMSSNLALVPISNILLAGDLTDLTMTVAPVLGQVGSTWITLSVTAGTLSNSTSFLLTVTPLPAIALTSPLNGAGFLAPATITLGANVVSSGHTLSAVQFYSGATLLGQASAPPYTLAWTGVSAGNYSLSAAVTDELGSTVTSTPALIAVTNAPGGSGPPVAPPGTISSIPNQVVVENSTTGPLPFTISDVQSLLPNLSFYAMSSNLALVPISNILLAGDLTDLTMTVAPVLGQVGSTWITLSVTAGTLSNSTSFLLTVTPPPGSGPGTAPTISSLPDQMVDENCTMGPLPFTVGDAQISASNLMLSATSSNLTLVPAGNIQLGGGGTNRTVSVAPALGQVGSSWITLSVTDGTLSNSIGFLLTVTPLPTITLTSPLNGAGFLAPATITLGANVVPNGHTLSAVRFYNGATLLGQASAPPYTVVWPNVGNGNYSLSAAVTDELGSAVASTPALIAVTNAPVAGNPPVVAITAPANGELYLSPASVSLEANVISNGHTINALEYYNGSTYLGTAVQPPYNLTWTDATPGTCVLTCQTTYDNEYAVVSSATTIDVIGLPSPWLNTDVGSPEASGAAGQLGAVYFISGAGSIGALSDSFQFVYQPMSGESTLEAYVSWVQDTSSNAFAGVMVRESLAGGSEYVALGLTPDGRVLWSTRANTGGLALSATPITGAPPGAWLRLVLTGGTLSGFYSADGTTWTPTGTTSLNLGSNPYAGVAVSSGLPNVLNTSTFNSLNLYLSP